MEGCFGIEALFGEVKVISVARFPKETDDPATLEWHSFVVWRVQ
jgi:hypothetical protein